MFNKTKIGIVIIAIFSLFLFSCKKELSENEKQKLIELNEELSKISDEIDNSQKELENYSGGLIKTLIEVKVETLKINQALITQRISAIESDSPIKVETIITQPNAELAQDIFNDMNELKKEIKFHQDEADQYEDGLIKITHLLNVVQKEQAYTALQLQYYTVKYGLSTLPTVEYQSKTKIKESDPSVPIEDKL